MSPRNGGGFIVLRSATGVRNEWTIMQLKNEPTNWTGLALILVLIAVFAIVIHWMGLR